MRTTRQTRRSTSPRRAKIASTDPAWEAAKAGCRNIGHNEAVQEVAFLQRQYWSMWRKDMADSVVDVNEVLKTLAKKRIPFVLTGTHGISGWTGRSRAT